MAWAFYIFLLAWPAAEIAAFIQVAHWVGLLGAILGVVLSGVLGMALLRGQGLATATRAQRLLAQGEMPVAELFDGACLAVAGLLLILPGYLTDGVALVLLLPPVRLLLRRWLARRLAPAMQGGTPAATASTVIDGEWEVVVSKNDRTPPQVPPSPPQP